MAYWAATRLEANREKVAQFFLEQAGYEVYLPLVRWRTRRRRTRVMPVEKHFTIRHGVDARPRHRPVRGVGAL